MQVETVGPWEMVSSQARWEESESRKVLMGRGKERGWDLDILITYMGNHGQEKLTARDLDG